MIPAGLLIVMSACDRVPGVGGKPDSTPGTIGVEPHSKDHFDEAVVTRLINPTLQPVSSVQLLNENVLSQLKASGHIERLQNSNYCLTEKGLELFGRLVAKNEIQRTGFNQNVRRVHLINRLPHTVNKVTDIKKRQSEGWAEVTYTTSYAFPEIIKGIKQYVFAGEQRTASFRLLDDGWRLAN